MAPPKKYPDELRERAVRLYRESDPKPVIRQLARQLGVHHEALRNWIRQDEADRGQRGYRPTTSEVEELRRLRRENAELKRANEILKAASLDSDDQRNTAGGWVDHGSDGSAGNAGRDERRLVAALACR
ncbi:transposase [Micromonospora sp. DT233]|uniref:transposase n=1 Tax=Micromonospora sp. DT233 TaxID=3393432 RepID=UPI003CE6781D